MMRKFTVLFILALLSLSPTIAGGLLTNTNQSIHFLRNPARGASTEIDAIYTNPAGISKLPRGWHFSITNQSAFQTRTITSTAPTFVGFGDNETKKFKGTASAPIVPSVMAAYRMTDRWTISGSFAITGGGGKATFNNGLPSFESIAAMGPTMINLAGASLPGSGLSASSYTVDQYMQGKSFIYGAQLGATYKINDMFSVYAGFRFNIVKNSYNGYMRGLKVNVKSNLGHDGSMIYAKDIFEKMHGELTEGQEAEGAMLGILMHSSSDEGAIVDVTQTGWGVSPIIGLHFNYKKLDIGLKYEFRTSLNIENKTKARDNMNMFKDGVNTPHDIPGLLTVGVAYQIIPQLKVSAGFHNFFDSNADMDKGKQKYISGGTKEYLFGAEYNITPRYMVSAGMQFTRQGVKDGYQSDLSFALNSYSVGVGGAANITDKIKLHIAYFWTTYSRWNKEPGGGVGIAKDVFQRTNKVFGVGVDFSF